MAAKVSDLIAYGTQKQDEQLNAYLGWRKEQEAEKGAVVLPEDTIEVDIECEGVCEHAVWSEELNRLWITEDWFQFCNREPVVVRDPSEAELAAWVEEFEANKESYLS